MNLCPGGCARVPGEPLLYDSDLVFRADAGAGQTVRVADNARRALERSGREVVLDAAVKSARGREEVTVLTWRRTFDAALFGPGTASRNGARRREWVA